MAILDSTDFSEPGLYLIWPDGNRLALTRPLIEATTESMLKRPDLIPLTVRAAADYQPCDICPERDRATICHAIMTTLPFTMDVDRYMSYDKVTAIYREEKSCVISIMETTMQEALKFVAILSLTHYCEIGKKFGTYFEGVNPLLSTPDVAIAVYKNLFAAAGGRMTTITEIIKQMREELILVVRCQMKRLQLICAKDAFLNAFVTTYTVVELLFVELEKCLQAHAQS